MIIKQNKERSDAILYTCGVCNLQCRYCGIDKNPILAQIDKALGESFEGDYYFERIKQYFPNRGQLKCIQTWGGEPFLRMDRIYHTLHKVIKHYPYFDSMYSSTNFSFPNWTEQVFGLFDQFGQYPYRRFNYCLQLSCDGPEYINDAGRGEGVTKKCLENFNKFLNEMGDRIPENVNVTITLKPTLDNGTIRMLCDKQKLIEYYQFFEEEFIDKIKQLGYSNIDIVPGIPNTAVPSPTTQQEGIQFAEFCKICNEIIEENKTEQYFKYYEDIMPFRTDYKQQEITFKYSHHTCGSGSSMVGFLPNNMMSTCHAGFTHFIEEYKKFAAKSDRIDNASISFDKFVDEQTVRYCITDEGYMEHERQINFYQQEGTTARLANMTSLIVALAMAGQIEERYLNYTNAVIGAIFIQSHTSYCIKDNYNKTGSFTLIPVGLIKLLLNGALQEIVSEDDLHVGE